MFYDTSQYAAPRGDYQVFEDARGGQWYAIRGEAPWNASRCTRMASRFMTVTVYGQSLWKLFGIRIRHHALESQNPAIMGKLSRRGGNGNTIESTLCEESIVMNKCRQPNQGKMLVRLLCIFHVEITLLFYSSLI